MEAIVSNIGSIIEGHVLDVNKKHLESALKNYDNQLYLKWNPKKKNGFGMWEVRRRPNAKTAVYKTDLGKSKIFELEYVEIDFVHHVLDVDYLNYNVLTRIKEMDAWNSPDLIKDQDYAAEKKIIAEENSVSDELRYLIKQNRKYFGELQEAVRSGYNPAWFFGNRRK
jgi:hypothetical protein